MDGLPEAEASPSLAYGIAISVVTLTSLLAAALLFRSWRTDDKAWKGPSSPVVPAADHKWRIAIVGVMGSGRSTLASEFSERLGLKLIDLDALVLKDGANADGVDVLEIVRKEIKDASGSAKDGGWVCTGIYEFARTEVWDRADAIIYLHPLPLLRMWRVLRQEWWQSSPNSGGFLELLKSLFHASGFGSQQRQLRANLAKFHQEQQEKQDKHTKEQEERLAAEAAVVSQSQHLNKRLQDMKEEAQRAKQARDNVTATLCNRAMKDITEQLKKVQVVPKQQKLAPRPVPVRVLCSVTEIADFEREVESRAST